LPNVNDFEDICKNMFLPNFTLLDELIIPVYKIFEDLKFVTDLGVLSPKIASILSIWSGLAARGHTFCIFSQNIEKPHQKFQKVSPTIFNLKTDFVISSCAFQC